MDSDNTLLTAGKRLRRARVLAGLLTRRDFERKHKISANTLQGWEQGKNPLSKKGARRVVEALKWEGLLCSVDWLIHGVGMPPRPYDVLNVGLKEALKKGQALTEQTLREEEVIYKEVQFFKKQNLHSIILPIADDAMQPYYYLGDYVGGVRVFGDEVERVTARFCILELEGNLIVPRLLQKSSQAGLYNACCINPTTRVSPPNLYNVRVLSAAPIIWHRRRMIAFC